MSKSILKKKIVCKKVFNLVLKIFVDFKFAWRTKIIFFMSESLNGLCGNNMIT